MNLDDYAPKKDCLSCKHYRDPALIKHPFWGAIMVRSWCESRQEKVKTSTAETCKLYLERPFMKKEER